MQIFQPASSPFFTKEHVIVIGTAAGSLQLCAGNNQKFNDKTAEA
jgi:hypothetical protein